MPFDFQDPTREYKLEHPSGAVFTMRHWTTADQEVVEAECLVEAGKEKGQPVYKWNQTKDREIKVDRCLMGWSGITMDGVDLEFTTENKAKLPVGIKVWLVKEIEERAGLRMTAQEKKT